MCDRFVSLFEVCRLDKFLSYFCRVLAIGRLLSSFNTEMDFLGENHFLSLPRHDLLVSTARVPDTTTLAAHDFDVDTRTGFLPPQAPLSRLPSAWEEWEMTLDEAISSHLQLGDKIDLQQTEKEASERWRERVRKVWNSHVLKNLL